jgi:hypothetical protein
MLIRDLIAKMRHDGGGRADGERKKMSNLTVASSVAALRRLFATRRLTP